MAEGLQIFGNNNNYGGIFYGRATVDMSSYLSKYLGETDIIPTSVTNTCSGSITIPELTATLPGIFYVIDKIYTTNINLSSKTKYIFPRLIFNTFQNGLNWEYYVPDWQDFDNYCNVGIHIKYGYF